VDDHLVCTVVPLAGLLFPDEIDRVLQCGNQRFDGCFGLTSLQTQAVDLALHVFHARLGLVQHQAGARLGVLDDHGGVCLGVARDFVGQALGGQQRVAQTSLLLAVLGDLAFKPRDILAVPISLLQGGLVVIGGLDQERHHLGLVETAHHGTEVLLTQVERCDVHVCTPANQPRAWVPMS
jgi:hypothetical protein